MRQLWSRHAPHIDVVVRRLVGDDLDLAAVQGTLVEDGGPNLLGPFAHGRPDDRFLYVNSGTSAGQHGSPWSRRAKVKLGGIDQALVERALGDADTVLEARFAGTLRDGSPACATVPLLDGGWRAARRSDIPS